MATSKDQQKEFNTIWERLEHLRAGVHANDIEIHIVSVLFYRFVSEKILAYINKDEDDGFDYAALTDEQAEQARAPMTWRSVEAYGGKHQASRGERRTVRRHEERDDTAAHIARGTETTTGKQAG